MSEAFSIGLDTELIISTTPHKKNKKKNPKQPNLLQNKSAFKLLPYGTKHNQKNKQLGKVIRLGVIIAL